MSGRKGRRGFTLIEVLGSLAILLTLFSMVGSVLFFGFRQRQLATGYGEQAQLLRLAMQQISQDLVDTKYVNSNETGSTSSIEVVGYQPFARKKQPDDMYGSDYSWESVDSDWPGDLVLLAKVHVSYTIDKGMLRREIWADGHRAAGSSRILLKGLTGGSHLTYGPNVVEIVLEIQEGEGVRSASVRTSLHLKA